MSRGRSRTLVVAGLVLMLAGALDPLEGSVVILAGSGLAAAAVFGNGRRYRLQLAAFMLIAVGVAALIGLSALGGVGGNTGRSIWWLAICVFYPVGWLIGLVGAIAFLRATRYPASSSP